MAGGLISSSEAYTGGYRRIVILLIALVTVPTALLLALGILIMVFYKEAWLNLLFGILVITLVACVVTGSIVAMVLLKRESDLSKLQSDFVSKVSHELRTPLTSIRMFVEMLQEKRFDDPERMEASLEVLGRETARLTRRIERLLDWGRMEAGKRVYNRVLDSASDVVRDTLAAFDTATLGREVELDIDVPADTPAIMVDRAALVDALLNLLSNAYKYSPDEKNIRLAVSHDDDWVSFSVTDTGIGIPHREHRRIFDKFYRVDERLSQSIEGSGLGLSIVRHVARAHRGRIELDSEPGRGSAFTIFIPRPSAAEVAAQSGELAAA